MFDSCRYRLVESEMRRKAFEYWFNVYTLVEQLWKQTYQSSVAHRHNERAPVDSYEFFEKRKRHRRAENEHKSVETSFENRGFYAVFFADAHKE